MSGPRMVMNRRSWRGSSRSDAFFYNHDDGLLVATDWDEVTSNSFKRLPGSNREGKAWCKFYSAL